MAIHSNSPSITPRLGIDRVVFLITEIIRPPELDSCPVEQCTMHFRVMPGLLLDAHDQCIVCPMMIGKRSALSADAQLFQVAQEAENPHYGLSMFAKLTRISDYQTMVPEQRPRFGFGFNCRPAIRFLLSAQVKSCGLASTFIPTQALSPRTASPCSSIRAVARPASISLPLGSSPVRTITISSAVAIPTFRSPANCRQNTKIGRMRSTRMPRYLRAWAVGDNSTSTPR